MLPLSVTLSGTAVMLRTKPEGCLCPPGFHPDAISTATTTPHACSGLMAAPLHWPAHCRRPILGNDDSLPLTGVAVVSVPSVSGAVSPVKSLSPGLTKTQPLSPVQGKYTPPKLFLVPQKTFVFAPDVCPRRCFLRPCAEMSFFASFNLYSDFFSTHNFNDKPSLFIKISARPNDARR